MAPPSSLVSVIIATYNQGHLLCEAVASAASQDLEGLEVVVVDDGSRDNTPRVAGALASDRVRYLRQPKAGIASARNTGISQARGRFVLLLDPDDILLPGALTPMARLLDLHDELSFVTANSFQTDPHGTVLHRSALPEGPHPPSRFLAGNPVPLLATLFRRSALMAVGLFCPTLKGGEDWDLMGRLALSGRIGWHLGKAAGRHRLVPDRPATRLGERTDALLEVTRRLYEHDNMPIMFAKMRSRVEAQVLMDAAVEAWRGRRSASATAFLERARERHPSVLDEGGEPLLGRLVRETRGLSNAARLRLIREALAALPREWGAAIPSTGRVRFLLRRDQTRLYRERGEPLRAIDQSLATALHHPVAMIREFLASGSKTS